MRRGIVAGLIMISLAGAATAQPFGPASTGTFIFEAPGYEHFGAFRSGRRSPVRFLKNNGLAAANREAVLHVTSNEVALNAVVIPVCNGSHSPEEHQVLVSGT